MTKMSKQKKLDSQREAKLEAQVEKLKSKLKKQEIPTRGIESMFRLTARHQISLTSLSDNKANIMISVNSIILSIVVTIIIRNISENPNLILPTFAMLLTNLLTIIFAVLATRPHISSGTFTEDDIKAKKVNLLFFGNFYNMEFEDYDRAIKEMIKDSEYLYGNLIQDQYSLGLVLAKKYKLLRTCYSIFMFGIIVSVIAFAVAILYMPR